MITFERHIYGQEPIDLTRWLSAIEISLSTSAPFTAISATMHPALNERGVMPDPDEWVSVRREETGRTIAWGSVTNAPSPGLIRENPTLGVGGPVVRAVSWLTALQNAQVYSRSSGFRSDSIGTLFDLEDWTAIVTEMNATVNGKQGEALAKLLPLLAKLQLPESLGGGYLGASVAVVHDKDVAEALGLQTAFDRVQGPSLIGDRTWPTQTTVLSYLMSAFKPGNDMIEMFEILAEKADDLQSLTSGTTTNKFLPDRKLTSALKATPALMYRVKPWRLESTAAYLGRYKPDQLSDEQAASFGRIVELAKTQFPEPSTWAPVSTLIPKDEIISFPPPERSSAQRVNAVTADPCISGDVQDVKLVESFGLPIQDSQDVKRFGLRLLDVQWPFFGPDDTIQDPAEWTRVIASLAAQMHLRRERFYEGTLKTIARDDLRPGETFVAELPDGRTFSGYIEALKHFGIREGTRLTMTTTITYSRGTWDAPGRDPVTNPDRAAVVTAQPQPAPQPQEARKPVTKTTCEAGKPTGRSWGISLDTIDPDMIPAGLKEWAVSRKFKFPRNLSNQVNLRLHLSAAAGFVIERYWRQINPDAQILFLESYRTDTEHGTSHLDGAAFDFSVIFPASGAVLGPLNPLVPKIPVFQNWGALNRLHSAGRIPPGGRGIYINAGPTGVQGALKSNETPTSTPTNPASAGAASGPADLRPDRPPGGSAGTHYDLRGAFRYAIRRKDNSLTSTPSAYIWVDVDSDGSDEYRIGEPDSRGGPYGVWQVVSNKVKRYYDAKSTPGNYLSDPLEGTWVKDPFLPAVGPTVPNLLQVIGFQPSCFTSEVKP